MSVSPSSCDSRRGWISVAFGGSAALPSYPLIDGRLPSLWWFTDVVAVVTIAPVIEELLFRGVLVVALFTVFRRRAGRGVAGLVAVLVSTAVFVLVHAIDLGSSPDRAISTALLGLVCGTLVVLTGRIWPAVLVHVLFNVSFVALAVAGTYLG